MFFRTNILCKFALRSQNSYQNYLVLKIKKKFAMKKDIHPENYRPVAFKDMSNGDVFISRSTANTKDTIEIDGETLPLIKLEISSSSHPFFTGKAKMVDTAGRVDKFMSRYGNRNKK
jgi:large subunit ribosomal protein L31